MAVNSSPIISWGDSYASAEPIMVAADQDLHRIMENLDPEVAIDMRLHFLASVEVLGFLFISQKPDESPSVQVIHRIMKNALTALPPQADDEYFGLLGTKGDARVISISKDWFEATDPPFPTPPLTELVGVDDEDELLNLSASLAGGPDSIRRIKVIPLTPLLLAAVSKVADPMDMNAFYFAFKDSIDVLVADGLESAPTDLKLGLQFLWLAVHDPIPLIIPWNSIPLAEDDFIIHRYALLEKSLFPAPSVGVSSHDEAMKELMGRVVSLQEQQLDLSGKIAERSSTAIEDRSTAKSWTRLPAANQKLIRFMSKPCSATDPPSEPVPAYKQFLEMSEHLRLATLADILQTEGAITCVIDRPLAQALYTASWRQHVSSTPNRLSIFYFHHPQNLDTINGDKAMTEEEYEEYKNAHLLTKEMVKEATTSSIGVATTVFDLQRTFKNYSILLRWATMAQDDETKVYEDTLIYRAIMSVHDYIGNHVPLLESLQGRDSRFFVKILQSINIRVNLFLRSAKLALTYADVNESYLDFQPLFSEFEMEHTLSVTVPALVLSAMATAAAAAQGGTSASAVGAGDDDTKPSAKRQKTDKLAPAKNDAVPSAWKQSDFSKFRAYIQKEGADPVPELDGTAICVKFQCAGICVRGEKCSKKSTHKKLAGSIREKFDAWVQKALS